MPGTSETRVILIAIAGTFMIILDQTVMNTALPHIIAIFNETTDRAQLIVSAYMMATAISTPSAAFLAGRFGMKRIYTISQAGFLLGSVLCGVAWDTQSLIVFRVLQGLAGGVLSPLSMTFLYLTVPPQDRGKAMAVFGIPMMLAPAIGPVVGGYLVDYWSWRMVFYINVPVVVLAIILGYLWIEEGPSRPVQFDSKGFFLAAVGFSSILYAFSYAPTWHWNDWRIVTLLCVGGLCSLAWVIVELREKSPMLDLRMFKFRGYSMGIGLTFVTTIGLFSLIFLLPVFLQNLRGLKAVDSGLMTLPQAIGSMITMPLAGVIYDRIGPRWPSVGGLLLTGVCSLWMQVLDVTTPDDVLRWILLFRGMGMGLSMMPIMTYALSSVPQNMTPQASALLNVCRTIFGSLGIAIFATLLDAFTKANLASMVQTVTPDSVVALRVLSQAQVYLMQMGLTAEAARQAATTVVYQFVSLRAAVTAFEMNYVVGSVVVLLGVVAAIFLPSGRMQRSGTGPDMGA